VIVAIMGAGWDPVEEARARDRGFDIPVRTPELFWPLGGGHTTLSRMMAQFRLLGVDQFFVGMGEPGATSELVEDDQRKVYGAVVPGYGQSVWTDEQVAYVKELGATPMLMPDPQREQCWGTLLRMAPAMSVRHWRRLIVTSGDYVFRMAFLQHLVSTASWPSQFWFWAKHSIVFLDRPGFEVFWHFCDSLLPNASQGNFWLHRHILREQGVPHFVWGERRNVFDWMLKDWIEISHHVYQAILDLVAEDPVWQSRSRR